MPPSSSKRGLRYHRGIRGSSKGLRAEIERLHREMRSNPHPKRSRGNLPLSPYREQRHYAVLYCKFRCHRKRHGNRKTAFSYREVGEAGHTQQGDCPRKDRPRYQKADFRGRYVRAQVWAGRGKNGVFLPALLSPQRAFQRVWH